MKKHELLFFYCCLFSFLTLHATPPLSSLPQADAQNIVLSSTLVKLKGVDYAFNASFVREKNRNGYLLFFRNYIQGQTKKFAFGGRIGVARLHKNFKQDGRVIYPNYPYYGAHVDDARSFWINNDLYIMYYVYPTGLKVCPCLLKINPSTFQPEQVFIFPSSTPEKNWVPLLHTETPSYHTQTTLTCARMLYPLDFVTIDLKTGAPQFSSSKALEPLSPPGWIWGPICGGTQAEYTDGVYLGFFHSWYPSESGRRIYVMGAYTLDGTYPHRLLSISPCPIVFRELYTQEGSHMVGPPFFQWWAKKLEKVTFPMSFVIERQSYGNDLIHLACGENDNAIRIITIDKTNLLRSLIPINP